MNDSRKEAILFALSAFIRQRPGLEYANYGNLSAYRSEMRQITKDRHQAFTLLAAVSWRSISADDLLSAARSSFSGRLSIVEKDGKVTIDYCTGQYFPTEYRRAVCAVLSLALWNYWRDNASATDGEYTSHPGVVNMAAYLRKTAKRELGLAIAKRWFN